MLGGAAGVAIVVAVVLIVVGSGGTKDAATTTTPTATVPVKTTPTASIFAGIPQHGDTLGRANAPVTISVFEDPQCPFCRQWDLETLPTVIKRYVKTGRVKLVYRGIEIMALGELREFFATIPGAAQSSRRTWLITTAMHAPALEHRLAFVLIGIRRGDHECEHHTYQQLPRHHRLCPRR